MNTFIRWYHIGVSENGVYPNMIPSGKTNIAIENGNRNSEFSH